MSSSQVQFDTRVERNQGMYKYRVKRYVSLVSYLCLDLGWKDSVLDLSHQLDGLLGEREGKDLSCVSDYASTRSCTSNVDVQCAVGF